MRRTRDNETNPATRLAQIGAAAALVATAGDLMLLYVANARRAEFDFAAPGRQLLWIGGAAGVLAIPLYALGYRAASRLVAPASARGARLLLAAGAAGALVGAAIHGVTAVELAAVPDPSVEMGDPFLSLVQSNPLLAVMWIVAAIGVVTASAVFAWFVGRGRTSAPRPAAWAAPATVTVAIAIVGLPTMMSRAFLTPAAPNVAHAIFFCVVARLLERTPPGN